MFEFVRTNVMLSLIRHIEAAIIYSIEKFKNILEKREVSGCI